MTQANPRPSAEPRARWTLERYHSAINAGIFEDWKIELLNGELYEMSPEGPLHSDSIDELQYYLIDLIPRHISKVRIGHPVTLFDGSEPEPDIAIVRPGR